MRSAMLRPVGNPPSRFATACTEWEIPPPPATLHVYEDDSQEILAHNDSPDLGFRWSVNPYRGCFHACAYCYARPTHEYLGLGAGTDFDRKIIVKPKAPELLERAFRKPSWKGDLILFSGNTDCYQPLELEYGLTRACFEVCLRFSQPISIITKSSIIARDAKLIADLHRAAGVHVVFSIPFADAKTAHAIEPNAPPPSARFKAMRALAAEGVPVGVNIAPVIPGLGDREIPAILRGARESGAGWAHLIPVRLSEQVEPVFVERIREALPGQSEGILNRIRRARGGELNDPRFGHRFRGSGPEWEATLALFELWCRKLGYGEAPLRPANTFRVPGAGVQVALFSAPATRS